MLDCIPAAKIHFNITPWSAQRTDFSTAVDYQLDAY